MRAASALTTSGVTWLGVGANIGLVGLKGTAGVMCGSAALVADAAHSAGDLISDVVTFASLRIGAKPPDKDHPFGHAKFETVGALTIGVILAATGVGIGAHAVEALASTAAAVSSVTTSTSTTTGTAAAAAAAPLSILTKEGLYRVTRSVGEREDSPVVVANAHHHRSDALSSVVALAGIGGAGLGVPLLDPVAGVVVAAMIAQSGVKIGWDAVKDLTDTVDASLQLRIHAAVEELETRRAAVAEGSSPGLALGRGGGEIRSHSHLRVRMVRSRALVDLHIVVDPTLTVSAAHTIADRVRHHLKRRVPEVKDTNVHVDVAEEEEEEERGGEDANGDAAAWVHRAGGGLELRDPSALSLAAELAAASVEGVLGVTHTHTHFVAGRTAVEATIVVNEDMSVKDARLLGRAARIAIEGVEGIDAADVHLELEDE